METNEVSAEVKQKPVAKFKEDTKNLEPVPNQFFKKFNIGDNIYFYLKNGGGIYFGTIRHVIEKFGYMIKINTIYSDYSDVKRNSELTINADNFGLVYNITRIFDLCENAYCNSSEVCDPKTGECIIKSVPMTFDINKQYANIISKKGLLNQLFKQASLSPCDFYETSSILTKTSKSKSVILFDKFAFNVAGIDSEIAMKMYFKSKYPSEDNSLEIEHLIYKQVTNPLIFNGITPHLMIYHGSLNCKSFMQKIIGNKELQKQIDSINETDDYDMDNMYLLILERSKGNTLGKIIYTPNLTWDNFYHPVLFQICYTLLCFQQVKFMHNDLHLDNIFIEIHDEPQSFAYQAGNNYFNIVTKYVVKIFDYDRSSKQSSIYSDVTLINTRLDDKDSDDLCSNIGQCNKFSPFVDCFNVLWNLYHREEVPEKVKGWILQFVSEMLLEEDYSWGGIPCVCKPGTKPNWCPCKLYPFPENELRDVLLNGFQEYLVKPNENPLMWKIIYN